MSDDVAWVPAAIARLSAPAFSLADARAWLGTDAEPVGGVIVVAEPDAMPVASVAIILEGDAPRALTFRFHPGAQLRALAELLGPFSGAPRPADAPPEVAFEPRRTGAVTVDAIAELVSEEDPSLTRLVLARRAG